MSQQGTEIWGSSYSTNEVELSIGVVDVPEEEASISKTSGIFIGRRFITPIAHENTLSRGHFSILRNNSDLGVMLVNENRSTTPFRLELALSCFQLGSVSLGRAAEMAGLKYDTFIDELRHRDIELDFGPETAEEAEMEERTFLARTRNTRSV